MFREFLHNLKTPDNALRRPKKSRFCDPRFKRLNGFPSLFSPKIKLDIPHPKNKEMKENKSRAH